MKQCLLCGVEIPKSNKFCCQSHAAIYNNRHRLKKSKKCSYCGQAFFGWKHTRNKYCSEECASNAKRKENERKYFEGKIKNQCTLKGHYIKHNAYKCSICGISEWNDQELVLILDHIDGDPENNKPDNLRLVCPNCDSQLPTYKKKNAGHGRAYRRQRYAEGKSY